MKKFFKKLTLMVVALLTFSIGSNYTVKEVKAEGTEIVFELGANGTASHNDGSEKNTYSEAVDGYTLSITHGSKMYTDARDAKGNSCIKMGTKSVAGKFTISNIPDDVTSIVIFAAKYKSNTTKLSVASTTYTLNNASDNGVYDEITVDTTSEKSIAVETQSGGYRCMINTITYVVGDNGGTPVEPETTVTISGNAYTEIGKSVLLTATTTNYEGTVVWSSSNTSVATVDQNGNVTAVAMGKTTISAIAGEKEATMDFVVYPIADSELTIAEALKVCELTGTTETTYKYYLQGNIIEIKNTTYGNVVIEDSTGSILIYGLYKDGVKYDQLELQPIVGDTIKVYGTLVNYNNITPEMSGKPELIEHKVNSTDQELIAMTETTASLGFNYTYDEVISTTFVPATEATLTFDNKEKRTTYNTSKQVWEENGVIFTNDKGSSTTNVADYVNPVRVYKNSSITIEVSATISKIVFDSASGDYLKNLENSLKDSEITYEVESELVTCSLDKSSNIFEFKASAGQIRLDSITVSFGGSEVTTTTKDFSSSEFDNISILFGAEVNASLFEDFETVTAGVMFSAGDTLNAETAVKAPVTTLVETEGVYSVGAEFEVFADGVVVTDETKARLSQNITAAVYFVVDGETVILETKTVNVASMVETYLTSYATNETVKEHIDALKALKAYIEA